MAFCSRASTLNVTAYGAKGDAVRTSGGTTQNSTLVTLNATNTLTSADVGKAIELFGVGPATTGTNYQDLIAWIVAVTNGSSVVISSPAGCTASGVPCTYGTQNATAFQSCINACKGPTTDVVIPPGSYLLLPPRVFTSYAMQNYADGAFTVVINNGGIRLLGSDPANTILIGNGAWQLQGAFAHRGYLFSLEGPVSNTNALVFQNLTLDGGVQQGRQAVATWPASATDGSGWDVTHGAVLDYGPLPLHREKDFINCHIIHWRGEMLKSVTDWDSGVIQLTRCQLLDGAGSGYNFNWTPHVINGCLFSNLDMAMEFYVGTMQSPSVFENSTITNVVTALVLVGGVTNHPSPGYTIQNNVLSADARAILIGPARNLIISGNQFDGCGGALVTDASAYQGNDVNRDIILTNNTFNQTYTPLGIGGSGNTALYNLTVVSNTAWGAARFAAGYGWATNVVFLGNVSHGSVAAANLNSTQLTGQWFVDDLSNQFPPQGSSGWTNTYNILTYAYGIHQETWVDQSNVVYNLEDRYPAQIPAGATLLVSNSSALVVSINSSILAPQPTTSLPPKGTAQYQWDPVGAQWTLANRPNPPVNLRLGL